MIEENQLIVLSDTYCENNNEGIPIKSQSQTLPMLIFHHDACESHNIRDHPEQPARVSSILAKLQQEWPIETFRLAPLCTDEHILLFHSQGHLAELKYHFKKSENGIGKHSIEVIDGDTKIMKKTREAVYRAVGSVVAAVDSVLSTTNGIPLARSAFCCVRPPGHHAEPSRACGFCFFNNAAIGARYAQVTYGISKVAVIDFDVHHGNGTEAGFRNDPTLFYGSTHEANIFPGTGVEPSLTGENATNEIDRRIVNRYLHAGPSSVQEFRCKWREILAEMERFQPGLVIISAGFDAHDEDPLASCELHEEDFEWATIEVVASCHRINPHHPVPCISVLEGGYDLEAISASAAVHVRALTHSYSTITPSTTTTTTLVNQTMSKEFPPSHDDVIELPLPTPPDILETENDMKSKTLLEISNIAAPPQPICTDTTSATIEVCNNIPDDPLPPLSLDHITAATTTTPTLTPINDNNIGAHYDPLFNKVEEIIDAGLGEYSTASSLLLHDEQTIEEVIELIKSTTLK